MNIHHLELFYHVAKNCGISRAVRKMPYGIQQPAVSAQILRLEEDLETVLFQRRPFRLTTTGGQLFRFIEPFFAQLDQVAAQIRGTTSQRLRLAAAGPILRTHFPAILAAQRQKFPALRLTLRETNQLEAEKLLQENEIELAITELEGKSPPGIKSCVILELPLAFMVPKDSKWRSAEQFFRQGPPREALISLPAEEAITRLFQKGFARRGLNFAVGVEVSSLEDVLCRRIRRRTFVGEPGLQPRVGRANSPDRKISKTYSRRTLGGQALRDCTNVSGGGETPRRGTGELVSGAARGG